MCLGIKKFFEPLQFTPELLGEQTSFNLQNNRPSFGSPRGRAPSMDNLFPLEICGNYVHNRYFQGFSTLQSAPRISVGNPLGFGACLANGDTSGWAPHPLETSDQLNRVVIISGIMMIATRCTSHIHS